MEIATQLLIVLSAVILILILLYSRSRNKNSELKVQLQELLTRKQSQSVKYGRMSEQFFPFLESYPYDKDSFRFIGNPIDGVQFEKDKIIFIEFKTGDSRLSTGQRDIKDLVNKGKVEFREFRIS